MKCIRLADFPPTRTRQKMTDSNKKNADDQDDLVEHTFDITIPVAGIAAAVTAFALFAFIIYSWKSVTLEQIVVIAVLYALSSAFTHTAAIRRYRRILASRSQ